ncbi:protein TASOR-like isoform X2 [Engraulis encrasicolus]
MGKDVPKEGVLVPVSPGSAIFHDRILPPLHNSYLYEESKKAFIYSSAHLINNGNLQKRYAAFREEKRKSGYTDEELHETFGFLLFEDESKANKLSDSGLLVGHSSASTIGDPSKGVYVSKYSDCLDLKRWYCGKSGHIAIVKLTKGRVKEVNENYTLNLTAPTEGFDCHESDQLKAVTPTTSSFLAFERTQHYLYELRKGRRDTEMCPRHVCPFAIVAFSYGKAEPAAPESSEKR